MSVNSWSWAGSRWWKFDFHTHTPASNDYGKGANQAPLKAISAEDWLLHCMRAKIDCVAVTDHNSGAWIDPLKAALAKLKYDAHPELRPLTLFPGVEISVNGGVHVLAIMAPDRTTSDIDSLLGRVGFNGTRGTCDATTTESFVNVVEAVQSAGGLAIPAHVDCPSGLFQSQHGTTLTQSLACDATVAIEVVDPNFVKPQQYIDMGCEWTEVLGSDAHHPSGGPGQRCPGSHYTWVKMGSPNLEGLRLALLDGALSVRRSDETTSDPNSHAAMVLESIEVEGARYLGRPNPLTIELNPWLNAVIGGRGTGKSTLVEFLRLVLRREKEVPEALSAELKKYGVVYRDRDDEGLLTDEADLSAIYRKDGSRFKVQWSPSGDVASILEEAPDGTWAPSPGEITDRFPIRIFSQKQIYQLAKEPGALLRVVDEAPAIERREWDQKWEGETTQFLSLRARARELEAGLADERRLRGQLDDIKRKLVIFEASGHADVLRAYQRSRHAQRALDEWLSSWHDAGARVRTLAAELVPTIPDESRFDREISEDRELLELAEQTREKLAAIQTRLRTIAGEAETIRDGWVRDVEGSTWRARAQEAAQNYEALKTRLEAEGAGEPSTYGELVQQRQRVENQLTALTARREQAQQVRAQADRCLERLQALRRDLSEARADFLQEVLANNEYVRVTVTPYRSEETVESQLRGILGREGPGFERDIGTPGGDGLLGEVYKGNLGRDALEQRLADLKRRLRRIASGQDSADGYVRDARFAAHLRRLPPEALDRLDMWFPGDSLAVEYSPTGDGKGFRAIQDGSPGQKTAALLAFLLAHGTEPLVLDQPEDDLDNHLIYELIVAQLRKVKASRQVIVVTHNPNIVVNGDAELVVALSPRGGQTQIESKGSLQDACVRQTICTVMEGGREAFDRRYRRIALELNHDRPS